MCVKHSVCGGGCGSYLSNQAETVFTGPSPGEKGKKEGEDNEQNGGTSDQINQRK